MPPLFREEDFADDLAPLDFAALFAPEERPLFTLRPLDLLPPERDFFALEDLELEALRPVPAVCFRAEDLPPDEDLLPPLRLDDEPFALPAFELPLFFEDDFRPPDEALLFFEPPLLMLFFPPKDFPELIPAARPTAPAACDTARFAEATVCGLVEALPASAPIIPPTTAPTGPATLPTTAPAAAPASVLEIVGIVGPSEEDDSLPDDS